MKKNSKKKTKKSYRLGIKFNPTDVRQVNMFRLYLPASYKLAFSINKGFRPPCDSDLVSDVAVNYLEQAIATYNTQKNSKFETHLYMHLRSGFRREIMKLKTQYRYIKLQHVDQLPSDGFDRPFLDSIPDPRIEVGRNDTSCDELIIGVRHSIGEFGQQIFELMIHSDIVLKRYNKLNTSRYKAKTLNAGVIAKILHKPRSSVHLEVKKIQDVTKRVQERLKEGLPV